MPVIAIVNIHVIHTHGYKFRHSGFPSRKNALGFACVSTPIGFAGQTYLKLGQAFCKVGTFLLRLFRRQFFLLSAEADVRYETPVVVPDIRTRY